VRIDMSEYMEKHTVARLIGAPPGYIGYEEGGQLTEAVRRRPYAVILFDEIEKAHQDVFNVLLQILDDGRLTDGQGRVVDFKNAVIIMTSNVGSEARGRLRLASAGYGSQSEATAEDIQRITLDALRSTFRPEFLNRVDEIIIFNSLSVEHIRRIVEIQLARVQKRLVEQNIALTVSDAAEDLIAHEGYDPVYGARPLKRVIQKKILDALSLEILAGRFKEGDKITADMDKKENDKIVFERS